MMDMYTGIALIVYIAIATIATLGFAKTKQGKTIMDYALDKLTL